MNVGIELEKIKLPKDADDSNQSFYLQEATLCVGHVTSFSLWMFPSVVVIGLALPKADLLKTLVLLVCFSVCKLICEKCIHDMAQNFVGCCFGWEQKWRTPLPQ